jgi:hypothetical protein
MTIHKIDQRYIWIILGGVAIFLRIIIPAIWLETFYSRGLFIGVRFLFDYTTGLLPIPMLYVFVFGLLSWLGTKLYRRWKANRRVADDRRIIVRIGSFILNILAFASAVIFFFLFLWGFNYGRVPVEDHIGIKPAPLDQSALLEELNQATIDLIQAYEPIANLDSLAFAEFAFNDDLESIMRKEVSNALAALGYPQPGRPRARMLRPTGVLLRISTAGFYMPLVAECNIDAGLHPLQIPHVMAHELAHGYGFGNEGTCNFWAYLSCRSAIDPRIRYSGLLSYWRSVAAQYRWVNPEDYKRVRATLPAGILKHMQEIRTQMNKFPDLFPAVRDATYNAYLKAQGIEEGLLSYSRVVLLVKAYRERVENND